MSVAAQRPNWLSTYRELSKSGIVALVLISVMGGFFIGHPFEKPLSLPEFMITLLGVLFLASGSSALNQVQERKLDALMPRTAKRPLPSERISLSHALAFIGISIVVGLILLFQISASVFILGLAAIALYNGLYTMWWKRHWAFAAVPGAIPGALPILMGFAASQGNAFHPAGVYLFALLFFWQMPHFWVLAIRYKTDYEQGGIPTLPVVHGSGITSNHIVVWCLAYVALALIAPLFLKVGVIYLVSSISVSLKLLWSLKSFCKNPESKNWLSFFLWVNFSLIIYIAAAALDLWSVYLWAIVL
jgi:protoheme IX farnesyltransferase